MNIIRKDTIQDINQEINLINPVMRPEEVRSGDPIVCTISSPETREIKIWSYCPFGFEFIDNKDSNITTGEQLKFCLSIGKTEIDIDGSIVFLRSFSETENIVGVRINYNPQSIRSSNEERRANSRWICPDHLLPTGTAPNPTRYNDFIFFRIVDISSNGLKIATSLRNKFLSIGQILECTLSVPMIGTLSLGVRINRVAIEAIQGKEQLILGVSFVKSDDVVSSTLSEYLLTFAEDCSVRSLRDAGFKGSLGTSYFDFTYSKTTKDYDDVLDLRFEAYKDGGKLSDDVTRDFMRDEFDSRSRILTVKSSGKLVGSARAMFHETGDKTSHERYLTYPEDFPNISKCLEVSRVCVKPDFQGAGLAREMAKHLALLTIKAGRKYVYLSAAGPLIEFWRDLGFKDTGISYVHNKLGNLEHKLLINDVERSILGRGISASTWKESYQHLYNYCVDYGLVEPSTLDTLRVNSFKLFRKISLK